MKTINFTEWFRLKVITSHFTDKLKEELNQRDIDYKTKDGEFGSTTIFYIEVCGLSNLTLVSSIIKSLTE